MFNYNKIALYTVATFVLLTGCTNKLDLFPQNDTTSDDVFTSVQGIDRAMAKVYGSYALTGNQGPAGQGDVSGDEGFSEFVRGFWNVQELPTDEAVVSWGDVGLPDFHNMSWTPSNGFLRQLYARSLFQITVANNYLKEATESRTSAFPAEDAERFKFYRAEARFIRAYQYWVLMDVFGNIPFSLEVSAAFPARYTRAQLFAWVEGELKEIEPLMMEPRAAQAANKYGRADRGAVWALLARMYLNAKVYSNVERYSDAATYAKKVIDAGYTLAPNYRNLMTADNSAVSAQEFILTVNYDGLKTQCYGGTTFLVNASNGSEKYEFKFGRAPGDTVRQGISYGTGGWNGLKTTSAFVGLFPDSGFAVDGTPTVNGDQRAQFVRLYLGRTKPSPLRPLRDSVRSKSAVLTSITQADQGIRVWKYRNVTSTGAAGQDPSKTFGDADFPLFRLAEMYLIYAEAAARGAADRSLAVQYINALRQRAYGNGNGAITDGDLTERFVLDERGRELYWEGHRRTDLVRYGLFTTGTYLWPFKGGVAEGTAVDEFRNLYPIPSQDVLNNPNLIQNPGY
jgi:hypothetical protein